MKNLQSCLAEWLRNWTKELGVISSRPYFQTERRQQIVEPELPYASLKYDLSEKLKMSCDFIGPIRYLYFQHVDWPEMAGDVGPDLRRELVLDLAAAFGVVVDLDVGAFEHPTDAAFDERHRRLCQRWRRLVVAVQVVIVLDTFSFLKFCVLWDQLILFLVLPWGLKFAYSLG